MRRKPLLILCQPKVANRETANGNPTRTKTTPAAGCHTTIDRALCVAGT